MTFTFCILLVCMFLALRGDRRYGVGVQHYISVLYCTCIWALVYVRVVIFGMDNSELCWCGKSSAVVVGDRQYVPAHRCIARISVACFTTPTASLTKSLRA